MDKLLLLSQINLFQELPMDELKEIDKMSTMKPVKKGTLILSPSNSVPALFLIKQGQVRLYRMNEQGKQFTIDILVDGNIFGETSNVSLTDDQVYVESMADSYLCMIGKDEFESIIKQKPEIALKLIKILSSKLKDICDISEKIALGDVRQRLLFLLVKLSEKSGKRKNQWQPIDVKLTHSDLATMVGSTRETVSTIMGQMKKDGLIKKGILSLSINIDKTKGFF